MSPGDETWRSFNLDTVVMSADGSVCRVYPNSPIHIDYCLLGVTKQPSIGT